MSVTLKDFTIKYGNVIAVDNFTAAFSPGSTGLLGVNGAGKSSLIKGLLSLVSIHSGSAAIMDKDINRERKAIRQIIGYMPEDDCLIPGLTGIGMVQYAGELCGMSWTDAMQRGHEVLFVVGLGEARYRKVETYSSGMKQRIKLAQALVHDPRLLFLDEPTSGMDPKGRHEMLELIQYIANKEDMSIVMASHILVDVEKTCEQVVIMHKGKVLEQGSIEELKGSTSEVYNIRVDGDREAFVKLLKTRGCEVQYSGKNLLDVTLPKGNGTEVILAAAVKTRVQLRKMVANVQTLSDVFIKLVGEDSHANL